MRLIAVGAVVLLGAGALFIFAPSPKSKPQAEPVGEVGLPAVIPDVDGGPAAR